MACCQGLEGPGKVTNRTWTISSHPDETAEAGAFSISVKRAGLASRWLHARAAPSDITLEWRGAGGEFVPAPGAGPVLLLAGGIGGVLHVLFIQSTRLPYSPSTAGLQPCCLSLPIASLRHAPLEP